MHTQQQQEERRWCRWEPPPCQTDQRNPGTKKSNSIEYFQTIIFSNNDFELLTLLNASRYFPASDNPKNWVLFDFFSYLENKNSNKSKNKKHIWFIYNWIKNNFQELWIDNFVKTFKKIFSILIFSEKILVINVFVEIRTDHLVNVCLRNHRHFKCLERKFRFEQLQKLPEINFLVKLKCLRLLVGVCRLYGRCYLELATFC